MCPWHLRFLLGMNFHCLRINHQVHFSLEDSRQEAGTLHSSALLKMTAEASGFQGLEKTILDFLAQSLCGGPFYHQ